jgi:DNA-binding transcriptional MerR regulator
MNGLIDVPRKENGYRYYGDKEISALKIIKTLKYANYSLMAIRSLMTSDEVFSNSDKVKDQLDIEEYPDEIVSVHDRLLMSIDRGIENGEVAFGILEGLVVCE